MKGSPAIYFEQRLGGKWYTKWLKPNYTFCNTMIPGCVAMQPCDLHKLKKSVTFDRMCFPSMCARVCEWEVRVLHPARPPSGLLFTLPHTTQRDHSSFTCKTWYEHSYTVMNSPTTLRLSEDISALTFRDRDLQILMHIQELGLRWAH